MLFRSKNSWPADRPLREGFTTGTAAAAAACAAVAALLGGGAPVFVSVPLPPLQGGRLEIPVAAVRSGRTAGHPWALATVIKDGGDDPDATHGLRLQVLASPVPPPLAGAVPAGLVDGFPLPVFLYAGKGVGRVTMPGLPLPPGEPAINPDPRRQIAAAVCEAAMPRGYGGELHLTISVPRGEERARRTLNPRLGIVGGISILGTRGIVRPYSHQAWRTAIVQAVDVAEAAGISTLLFSTGRRSERLLRSLYPYLPDQAFVQAADQAAFSLRLAGRRSFSCLVWGCFPGKLLKLAQGLEWTHARSAPADLALPVSLWREHGDPADLDGLPTVAGILSRMRELSPDGHRAVLAVLAERALAALASWLREENGPAGPPELRLHVFSPEGEAVSLTWRWEERVP
ncbi:MAG: cobalt-precorrin-5B (C(1))-methyltransferase CbiD [Desulfovibrio sp.]|jgi:cobalt-precorrin-5B (C1)-methyltransferase|nr:cobalt-precorrin-5B (C(1))-methyltransferase CbiD [Desulfovibrio sp.]